MSTSAQTLLTEEEYLDIERSAGERSEYFGGKMYAMSGASVAHVRIGRNIVFTLNTQLRGGPCEVFPTDLRLRVSGTGLYTYPDVMVVCGAPQTPPETDDILLNPTLIVEVLSKSTRNYDRGEKFKHYRSIPSLTTYLTVAQDTPHIESYRRTDSGSWIITDHQGWHTVVTLDVIGATLPLSEVYYGVDLVESTQC